MSLEKVTARLGKAASEPGAAFVSFARVRRRDGIALDDAFAAFSVFQKQMCDDSFQTVTHWEKGDGDGF